LNSSIILEIFKQYIEFIIHYKISKILSIWRQKTNAHASSMNVKSIDYLNSGVSTEIGFTDSNSLNIWTWRSIWVRRIFLKYNSVFMLIVWCEFDAGFDINSD